MKTSVEFQCKLNLLELGVPNHRVQEWFEAVYAKPDTSLTKDKIGKLIAKITDSDVMDLLTLYGEEGSLAAVKGMIRFFSKLYGVSKEIGVAENSDKVETLGCESSLIKRKLEFLRIAVHPQNYKLLDGGALLFVMAHEIWHAWQADRVELWLNSLRGKAINFDISPKDADLAMLYYVDYNYSIKCFDDDVAYAGQLTEDEAYFATKAMMWRLEQFSRRVFELAATSLDRVPAWF